VSVKNFRYIYPEKNCANCDDLILRQSAGKYSCSYWGCIGDDNIEITSCPELYVCDGWKDGR
jgi:hypothetical protein